MRPLQMWEMVSMKNKYTVCIMGGLGNQMFLYAFYKYMRIHLGYAVVPSYIFCFLNRFAIIKGQKHIFLSDVFCVDTIKGKKYLPYGFMDIFRKMWFVYHRFILKTVYKETKMYVFDTHMDFQKKYFFGYFQCYKYAEAVKQYILQDFQLKPDLSPYAKSVLHQIQSTPNSVAIHIRRGDYVVGYNGYWQVLSVEYYISAWAKIIQHYPDATPYIFSQDMQWCRQNLGFLKNPVFVTPNDDVQYEDMILMSACTHNIIANSSYSWWGAYLNQHSNKIVVCPSHWHKNLNGHTALQDFIPPDWNIV